MTALVGQAYRQLPGNEILNVDVLWSVFGFEEGTVRQNAVKVMLEDMSFLVMHPMDVLRSRLINLFKLHDKQNEGGLSQLRFGVDVMRAHLQAESAQITDKDLHTGRSPLQPMV